MSTLTHPEPLPTRHRRRTTHSNPRPSAGNVLLGFLGELLITAGVLIGLFVVWQVYYTDIIGQREAAGYLEELEGTFTQVPDAVGQENRDVAPPELASGQFGVLYVPRWGEDYRVPIAEGTEPEVIDHGIVGHYPQTEAPGQVGNFALAGHRQSRGKPFRYVE